MTIGNLLLFVFTHLTNLQGSKDAGQLMLSYIGYILGVCESLTDMKMFVQTVSKTRLVSACGPYNHSGLSRNPE